MTSDIVTAEVVEVERPKRPELWVAVWRDDEDEWVATSAFMDRKTAEDIHNEKPRDGDCLIRIPAEDAPAAATRVADAVEEILKLGFFPEFGPENGTTPVFVCHAIDINDEFVCEGSGVTGQAAAAACLAALKALKGA